MTGQVSGRSLSVELTSNTFVSGFAHPLGLDSAMPGTMPTGVRQPHGERDTSEPPESSLVKRHTCVGSSGNPSNSQKAGEPFHCFFCWKPLDTP
jgi:hypothetical protein